MRITNFSPVNSNLRWVSKDGIGAFGRLLIGTVITLYHQFRMYYPEDLWMTIFRWTLWNTF
jgi:hypothetical protein